VPTPQRLRYRKNGCDVFACERCGVGRAEASGFDPARYYGEAYFDGRLADGYADYAGSEAVLRRDFAATLAHLLRFVSGGRLLEVGCAHGFFLLEARSRFEVHGIELAESAVRACHARGLASVRRGRLDAETLHGLPAFDAIVLLDVIEHLEDPGEAFRLLAGQLAPNGVVLLTTGDWSSLLARALGRHWRLMTPPQHLSFFTPRSLERLGRRHGLALEELSRPGKRVPAALILHQLARMFGLRPRAPRAGSALSCVGIPLNLFDALRVVYRKT
jgi:SAM-dependent methyltransferase